MPEIHEECGVFGIWSPETRPLARLIYYGLIALQHRGQEAAGIAINRDRTIYYHKDTGLVSEVFTDAELEKLGDCEMAVGHVRYSTSGSDSRDNAQPMVTKHVKGQLALCHNGNLTNSFELRHKLEERGCIFHTTSDTEVISYIITQERLMSPSIESAVEQAMHKLEGAYSFVIMSPAKLIAVRDPHGFRPLCYGITDAGEIVFASETCALDAVSAKYVRDVDPGEIIVVDKGELRSIHTHERSAKESRCVFEYIYFARPDSVVDGVSVHMARQQAGRFLAQEHPADADIVIGVPDSGLDAAIGFAKESGLPYGVGLIKNKYIGRTFIAPDQSEREKLVHLKLNAVRGVLEGKRVVLIDDSIVRGTTSAQIVKLLREAGASEVHFRSSAPPFTNPCYYGTDIDSRENLIACQKTIPEIAEYIGADSLGYLSIESARKLGGDKVPPENFCAACFNGTYPTAVSDHSAKARFE